MEGDGDPKLNGDACNGGLGLNSQGTDGDEGEAEGTTKGVLTGEN